MRSKRARIASSRSPSIFRSSPTPCEPCCEPRRRRPDGTSAPEGSRELARPAFAFGTRVPLVADRAGERPARRARGGGVHDPRPRALRPWGDHEPGESLEGRASATLVLEKDVLQLDAALRGYVNTGDRRFLRAFRDARSSRRHRRRRSTAAPPVGRAGVAGAQARHRRRPVHGRLRGAADRHRRALRRSRTLARSQSPRAAVVHRSDSAAGDPGVTAENDLASARLVGHEPGEQRDRPRPGCAGHLCSPRPPLRRRAGTRRRPSRARVSEAAKHVAAAISRCGCPRS